MAGLGRKIRSSILKVVSRSTRCHKCVNSGGGYIEKELTLPNYKSLWHFLHCHANNFWRSSWYTHNLFPKKHYMGWRETSSGRGKARHTNVANAVLRPEQETYRSWQSEITMRDGRHKPLMWMWKVKGRPQHYCIKNKLMSMSQIWNDGETLYQSSTE